MYIDESGDAGLVNSPTRYFILSAIVIHELRWRQTLSDLVEFRKGLRDTKGLKIRDEIHSSDFINSPGDLVRIPRNDRLDILKKSIDWINSRTDLNVFSVCVDKTGKQNLDIFETAWTALLTRFENTISYRNFKGPQNSDERGIVFSDNTEGLKLRKVIRKLRHYNPTPHRTDLFGTGYRNVNLRYVIEDPILRDSRHSLLHQMCDVIAYCTRQKFESNVYMRRKGGHNFYKRLGQVLLTVVSKSNDGIVTL